ncbi:MAG TPA: glycosyltransferase family 39 protein [Xanthobacteraceae bacterium]|nr:glycosyltransferase family 39 protein [Xanthobacteraceae bacterium]
MSQTTQTAPRQTAVLAGAAQGFRVEPCQAAALAAVALIAVIVALRYLVARRIDLETDEAYYWLWSRHLAASYYDHPPLIAYLIRLGTALFGDTVLGVRSMAIACIVAASFAVYALAVVLFGDRRLGLLAALWFNMMPHTAFFSIVMYPDTPALLFWLVCCLALALVWKSSRGGWWYAAGAAMGLLLLSKYTGVFLLAGIGMWLAISPQMRPWLKRPEPYVAAAIALVLFSPVIVWNAEHHWVSFAKQFGRALDKTDGGFGEAADFVGIQALWVSPLIFAFAVAGLAVATARGVVRKEANWLLLAVAAAPMLVYFLVHALSAEVLPQWPSAAYGVAAVAAVAAFAPGEKAAPRPPLIRLGFALAPWTGLAFTLALLAQMTVRPVSVPTAADPLAIFDGWSQLAADIRAVAREHHAGYIANAEYDTNAELAFYLRDLPVFQTSDRIRYAAMPPVDQTLLAHATGLYVALPPFNDLAELQKHYASVEPVGTIWRKRGRDPIKAYSLYEVKGYRGGVPY